MIAYTIFKDELYEIEVDDSPDDHGFYHPQAPGYCLTHRHGDPHHPETLHQRYVMTDAVHAFAAYRDRLSQKKAFYEDVVRQLEEAITASFALEARLTVKVLDDWD